MEVRPLKVHYTTTVTIRPNYDPEIDLLTQRSNFMFVVRTLAYVNRFQKKDFKIEL